VLPTTHAAAEINFYVTLQTQADWTRDALRIARRTPWIYTLGWFELYDDPPTPDHSEADYGLLYDDGRPKPAYAAFRDG
jgi:hypothetical protein